MASYEHCGLWPSNTRYEAEDAKHDVHAMDLAELHHYYMALSHPVFKPGELLAEIENELRLRGAFGGA